MENTQTNSRKNPQSASDYASEAQRIFDEAQERAAEIYDISRSFVRENQAIAWVSAGLACGVIGFFLGRATSRE